MTAQDNMKEVTALQAREQELESKTLDISTRMCAMKDVKDANDPNREEKPWGDAERAQYRDLADEHMHLSAELGNVRSKMAMEMKQVPVAALPAVEKNEADEKMDEFYSKVLAKEHCVIEIDMNHQSMAQRSWAIQRTDVTSGDGAGASALNPTTNPSLMHNAKAFGGAQRFVNMNWNTSDGNEVKQPVTDQTSRVATMLANEDATIPTPDPKEIKSVSVQVQRFGVGAPVSNTMLQDAAYDAHGEALSDLGIAIGRGISNAIVNADPASTGIDGLENIASLYTAASNSTIDFYGEGIELMKLVDDGYMEGEGGIGIGGAHGADTGAGMEGWMMSRDAIFELMKDEDTQGRPLWQPDLKDGTPGRISRISHRESPGDGLPERGGREAHRLRIRQAHERAHRGDHPPREPV